MKGFTDKDMPNQSGRCFIVTGANTGIGYGAAKALAAHGARVLLACRDKGKAEDAMRRIDQVVPGADTAFLPLDQADLDSVRAAAEIASAEPRIDVLLNNAGVMFPPLTRTKQGFELQFGVNHLGTFALTALLLPKLEQTPGSRVVVTSSLAHKRGDILWHDLNAEKSYSKALRYGDSKLANMLFFFELDRRLRAAGSQVAAIGCHPGVAATELLRHSGAFKLFAPIVGLLLNTAEQGAWPALQAATDPQAQSGDYYGPQGMGEAKGPSGHAFRTDEACDPELSERLWDESVKLTGIDPGLAPVASETA